jgi:uncharacterized iron-regulated protein
VSGHGVQWDIDDGIPSATPDVRLVTALGKRDALPDHGTLDAGACPYTSRTVATHVKTLATAFLLILLGGLPGVSAQAPEGAIVSSAYVPQRVYDTRRATFTDFEMMAADLARADVVLIGEQHDDANTHRLELAVLEALARRHVAVTLSLEMFERDVQASVDTYLSGASAEDDFLKTSRPWPRYAADYRPLVEFARRQHWPVVAANVPRRIAADVAKSGRSVVDSLSTADRPLAAADLQCPHDAYYDRFAEQMGGGTHQGGGSGTSAEGTTERYYWAQCIKDETMAESIASAFTKLEGRPGVIVHVTGSFHSDFGEGTGERVRRRLNGRRVATVSMLPVESLDGIVPDHDDLKRAEYLVYTIQ